MCVVKLAKTDHGEAPSWLCGVDVDFVNYYLNYRFDQRNFSWMQFISIAEMSQYNHRCDNGGQTDIKHAKYINLYR